MIQSPEQQYSIKALSLDTFWAGLFRAGALHSRIYKGFETRSRSNAIGREYRGWIAIAAKQIPYVPEDVLLRVINLAAAQYKDFSIKKELLNPELYLPGHILALGKVKDSWEMTSEAIAQQSDLERATGDWEPGRWAFELSPVIALPQPIPYKSKSQSAHAVTSEVYWQLAEVINEHFKHPTNQNLSGLPLFEEGAA
jgi:hypothetical protein